MPTDVNSVSLAASLFAEFFRILIYLVLIILGLRIIWRVEKRLDWVFKLLTLSFVLWIGGVFGKFRSFKASAVVELVRYFAGPVESSCLYGNE